MKTLMTETIYKHTVTSLQHFLCPQKFIMSCHITGSIYTPNKTHRIDCYYITNDIFFTLTPFYYYESILKKTPKTDFHHRINVAIYGTYPSRMITVSVVD
jgi:hypothetical protein